MELKKFIYNQLYKFAIIKNASNIFLADFLFRYQKNTSWSIFFGTPIIILLFKFPHGLPSVLITGYCEEEVQF